MFVLCHDFVFRIGEDEVHVTTRCSDAEMEPLYDEAGAFRGSHIGEQQRRWAKGEGSCLFVLYTVVKNHLIVNALSFVCLAQWNEWHSPWKTGLCKGWCNAAHFTRHRFFFSWFVALLSLLLLTNSFFSLQGRGTFPCDISVLEIQQDLDWNPKVSTLNVWPLYICDDGAVVFYRLESKRINPPTHQRWEFYFFMNFKNVFVLTHT